MGKRNSVTFIGLSLLVFDEIKDDVNLQQCDSIYDYTVDIINRVMFSDRHH